MLVTKLVIPDQFWGSQRNFKMLQSCAYVHGFCSFGLQCTTDVKEFIAARRFETISLHHVLQGFRTTDCDWVILPGAPGCYHG